jgi:hypothetical protein
VKVAPTGGGLLLEVTDDGRGLDRERVKTAVSRGHLGLASAAERVKAAGGRLALAERRAGRPVVCARFRQLLHARPEANSKSSGCTSDVVTCRAPDSSASRILVPVCAMSTSSSVGREKRTDLIGNSNSVNKRGTSCSQEGTKNLMAPRHACLDVEAVGKRQDRALAVLGMDADAVGADAELEGVRRVEDDHLAAVLIATRSQSSASSM